MSQVEKPKIWVHCASLGEFEQARPVIEKIRETYSNYFIVLSFFSPSGYEIRKDYDQADFICYMPFDTTGNASFFIGQVDPVVAFFVKYEFWYHHLMALHVNKIPTFLFSAIFREDQKFFRNNGGLFRKMLGVYSHIFVQNTHSAQLLRSINVQKVTVGGDTRFDRVFQICKAATSFPLIEEFKQNAIVMVVGSSWKADIEVLASLINLKTNMKFIIAPHELGEENLQYIEKSISRNTTRYSNINTNADVLIIDNIGMLSSLFAYAEIAYIGGSFGEGLHNTLEPATFGVPVLFGKSKSNLKYAEAIEMINRGGAFEVQDEKEVIDVVNNLLADDMKMAKKSGAANKNYVLENVGGTEKIMDHLKANRILDEG